MKKHGAFKISNDDSSLNCSECEIEIPAERIKAYPGTRLCSDCQFKAESDAPKTLEEEAATGSYCLWCAKKGIKSQLVWRLPKDGVSKDEFLGCPQFGISYCRYAVKRDSDTYDEDQIDGIIAKAKDEKILENISMDEENEGKNVENLTVFESSKLDKNLLDTVVKGSENAHEEIALDTSLKEKTSLCSACNKIFKVSHGKESYNLFCPECIKLTIIGSCPVCKSDLLWQKSGGSGYWKCSRHVCGYSITQIVFAKIMRAGSVQIKKNKLEKAKKAKEDFLVASIFGKTEKKNISKTILVKSKINNNLTALEVVKDKFKKEVKDFDEDEVFFEKGWFYQCQSDVKCVKCAKKYYELIRLPFMIMGRQAFRYGLVCLGCLSLRRIVGLDNAVYRKIEKYKVAFTTNDDE